MNMKRIIAISGLLLFAAGCEETPHRTIITSTYTVPGATTTVTQDPVVTYDSNTDVMTETAVIHTPTYTPPAIVEPVVVEEGSRYHHLHRHKH